HRGGRSDPGKNAAGARSHSGELDGLPVRVRAVERAQPAIVYAELHLVARFGDRQVIHKIDLALLVQRGLAHGISSKAYDDVAERAGHRRDARGKQGGIGQWDCPTETIQTGPDHNSMIAVIRPDFVADSRRDELREAYGSGLYGEVEKLQI